MRRLLVAAALLTLPVSPARADAIRACAVPAGVAPAPARPAPKREVWRGTPVTGYILALSWSPQWCRDHRRARDAAGQCDRNHFGFIVHGLWPDGAGRQPRFCAPAPPLSPATVRASFCMTPSPTLMQHQWAAHGTCGWPSADAYLTKTRQLWSDLRQPDIDRARTVGDIRRAFARANPGLRPAGLFVGLSGGALEEVRICYDLAFRPTDCPRGVGAPDRATVRVAH